MSRKVRLDVHMLTNGLADSRQKATQLIRAGKVKDLNGQILDKPGKQIDKDAQLIVQNPPRFVSRGGEKLVAGIVKFNINVKEKICLDCGISTGGFTDCLLQYGASKVYGVDVGYGQTAWNIRNNPRVKLLERTNIRYLNCEDLYEEGDEKAEFFVLDLSFISIKLVLSNITSLLMKENREGLILIKPQFEVGKSKVGKNGVVRDVQSHYEVINNVIKNSQELGWNTKGLIASPIKGPAGNNEYLLWISSSNQGNYIPDVFNLVKTTLKD